MGLVKFKRYHGNNVITEIAVNPAFISFVEQRNDMSCELHTTNFSFKVAGKFSEVLEKLNGSDNSRD